MTDMRHGRLLQVTGADHNRVTLSFRVAYVPLLQWRGTQLSLLEGDCVGLSWPILKPGSFEPGFFLFDPTARIQSLTGAAPRITMLQ
jgi:hypothetical protein